MRPDVQVSPGPEPARSHASKKVFPMRRMLALPGVALRSPATMVLPLRRMRRAWLSRAAAASGSQGVVGATIRRPFEVTTVSVHQWKRAPGSLSLTSSTVCGPFVATAVPP